MRLYCATRLGTDRGEHDEGGMVTENMLACKSGYPHDLAADPQGRQKDR